MSLFRRPEKTPAAEKGPLHLLADRLAETERHPLKRIPSEDLPEEARPVAERLNARLDALATAEKEQQQFIADISHELRTPLTVLRGSLEVALEEDRPAEEYREAIGNALLELRHLTRISQNLLFLARGQSGRSWPWGEDAPEGRVNTREAGLGVTAPVGAFPDGSTPEGLADLIGNVREWTNTWSGDGRVLRGGSYADASADARPSRRLFLAGDELRGVGFRVVRGMTGR
jgi:signal transduction histidine kinase